MSSQLRIRILILVAAGCLLLFVAYTLRDYVPTASPLPKASEIASMNAEYYDARQKKFVTFVVPSSRYQSIFDALLPAKRDRDPAKWEVLGELKIRLENGKPFHISLYSLDQSPGAFSAGSSFEMRAYYRGGGSSKLEASLDAAFDEAKATNAPPPPASPPK